MAKMPSYRLHKASGQGVTTIRGKTYYFGPFGDQDSKQRFRTLLAEYLLSNQSSTFRIAPADLTLAEVFLSYLDFASTYYGKDSTEYKNIKLAVRPIGELFPRALAVEFGPLQFKMIRQWWIDRGVSRQYCNTQMKRVLRAIKWLVSEEVLSATVHQALKCVEPLKKGRTNAHETPQILPVDDAVVEQTIPHLSQVVADMVRFQRLTGCRPGEVCAIKPKMVDRSGLVWEILVTQHKTAWRGKARTIYVGPSSPLNKLKFLNKAFHFSRCVRVAS